MFKKRCDDDVVFDDSSSCSHDILLEELLLSHRIDIKDVDYA